MATTVTLTREQEAGFAALVAAGDFASIEDAVRAALDAALAPFDVDALDIEEGRRLIAEGDASGPVVPLEQHRKDRDKFIAELVRQKRA